MHDLEELDAIHARQEARRQERLDLLHRLSALDRDAETDAGKALAIALRLAVRGQEGACKR